MKVITLMPTRGLVFTKAEQALEQELLTNDQLPFILRTDNQPLPDCRNTLIESALEIPEWTHALLVDDDVIMPLGGLKKLRELDVDIAFIDYPMHYTGERWGRVGTATYDDWLPGMEIKDKPVAWAGLGCCLVKRAVFAQMAKPIFRTTEHTFSRDDHGHITINDDKNDFGGGGEDTYFFTQARKLGFTIKGVPDVFAGHARIVKTVRTLDIDKYSTQHQIGVNSEIKSAYR